MDLARCLPGVWAASHAVIGVGHLGMVDATYARTAILQILNITSSSKTNETLVAIESLPQDRRQLSGDKEILLESDSEDCMSDRR